MNVGGGCILLYCIFIVGIFIADQKLELKKTREEREGDSYWLAALEY